jgi:hypothetical protein
MAGGQGFVFGALVLTKFLDLSLASRALERFFFTLAFIVQARALHASLLLRFTLFDSAAVGRDRVARWSPT